MNDSATRYLLLGPIVVAPWLLGSAEPGLNRWIVAPLALSGVAILLTAWRHGRLIAPRAPLVALFTVLGAVIGLAQLAPVWPSSGWWAPRVAELWAELGGVQPGDSAPATLDPAATLVLVGWLFVAAMVVTIAPRIIDSRDSLRRVLAALSVNGALLAIFQVLQFATWNGRIYWIGPELDRADPAYGPFVYHNQAANYYGVALACLVGWWIAAEVVPARDSRAGSEPPAILLGGRRGDRIAQLLCLLALTAGLFTSESRGGVLAAVAAAGFVAICGLRRGRVSHAAVLATLGGVGLAVALVLVCMGEKSVDRYATLLENQQVTDDSRLGHWKDSLRAAESLGLVGGGLGAYRHTAQAFQTEPSAVEFRNAHNQYLEAWVNGGPFALGLLLAAIALTGWQAWRSAGAPRRAAQALGVAVGSLLVFQAVHGFVDFCLYLPSQFLPMALMVGLLASPLASVESKGRLTAAKGTASRWRQAFAVALTAAAPAAACAIYHAGTVDSLIAGLPVDDGRLEATQEELEQHVSALCRSQSVGPDLAQIDPTLLPRDGLALETLGDLLVVRYRRAACLAIAEELGIDPEDPSITAWTSPLVLFQKASQAADAGDEATLSAIRDQDLVAAHLTPAYRAYGAALRACPLLERAAARRLELAFVDERFVDPRFRDERFAIAQRIGGMRADSLYSIGNLALLAGRREEALVAWRKCLAISRQWESPIARRAAPTMSPSQLVEHLLPSDPARLVALARHSLNDAGMEVARAATTAEALRLLTPDRASETYDLRPGERESLIAACFQLRGELPAAIEAYRAALRANPSRMEDRYQLAKALAQTGAIDEALVEARFCSRAKPSVQRYAALTRLLTRQSLDN